MKYIKEESYSRVQSWRDDPEFRDGKIDIAMKFAVKTCNLIIKRTFIFGRKNDKSESSDTINVGFQFSSWLAKGSKDFVITLRKPELKKVVEESHKCFCCGSEKTKSVEKIISKGEYLSVTIPETEFLNLVGWIKERMRGEWDAL